jgi:hypothetical protein
VFFPLFMLILLSWSILLMGCEVLDDRKCRRSGGAAVCLCWAAEQVLHEGLNNTYALVAAIIGVKFSVAQELPKVCTEPTAGSLHHLLTQASVQLPYLNLCDLYITACFVFLLITNMEVGHIDKMISYCTSRSNDAQRASSRVFSCTSSCTAARRGAMGHTGTSCRMTMGPGSTPSCRPLW